VEFFPKFLFFPATKSPLERANVVEAITAEEWNMRPWAKRRIVGLFGLGVLLAGVPIALSFQSRKPADARQPAPAAPRYAQKVKSLDELLEMSPEQLAEVDIAEMNLLCAAGLPGAEKLDIAHALATLDQWAARVRSETQRHLYRVTDPRYADFYHHSEAYMRASMLVAAPQHPRVLGQPEAGGVREAEGNLREVQEEVSIGRNGRRSHQAVARGRENDCGKLPDAVQGRQSKEIGEIIITRPYPDTPRNTPVWIRFVSDPGLGPDVIFTVTSTHVH